MSKRFNFTGKLEFDHILFYRNWKHIYVTQSMKNQKENYENLQSIWRSGHTVLLFFISGWINMNEVFVFWSKYYIDIISSYWALKEYFIQKELSRATACFLGIYCFCAKCALFINAIGRKNNNSIKSIKNE